MVSKIFEKLKRIWCDEEGFIFDSALDALGGFLVLVIWPLLSLIISFPVAQIDFLSYTFPIITIIIADMYDSFGRFKDAHKNKEFKLKVRVILDTIALLFTLLVPQAQEIRFLWVIPFVLLILNGVLLVRETYKRVLTFLILWTSDI